MANHVYFNITVEGVNNEILQEALPIVTVERKGWNDETIKYKEIVEVEKLPMYEDSGQEYDEDGHMTNWYDWGCTNVGAKWINFDDFDFEGGNYISGHSAWSHPYPFCERLVEYLCKKQNEAVCIRMTYEDEFRNFFGNDYFEGHYNEDDKEWYTDHHEDYRDHSDLIDILRDKFGDKVDDEDFDWWDLDEETDLVPQEYADDVVYNFFETGELTGD